MEISYGRVVLFAADLLPPWIRWREVWIIVIVVSNRGWMNGLIMLSCFCFDLWSCYCYYMNQYPQLSSTEISHYVACLAANSTAWEFGLHTCSRLRSVMDVFMHDAERGLFWFSSTCVNIHGSLVLLEIIAGRFARCVVLCHFTLE